MFNYTATDLIVYTILAASAFINIIIPHSGSSTVTPLLAILTNPHKAIALVGFYFVLSGVIRIYLFRKDIVWREINLLLPVSLIAAFIGSYVLVNISDIILLVVIFFVSLYYLIKKIKKLKLKVESKETSDGFGSYFVGLFSGFLQGAGLGGSEVRSSYLYGRNLNLSEVRGTSSLIGTSNFFLATIVRLFTNQVTIPDLLPLLPIFPLILLASLLGRRVINKLSKETTNILIVITMVLVLFSLAWKTIKIII